MGTVTSENIRISLLPPAAERALSSLQEPEDSLAPSETASKQRVSNSATQVFESANALRASSHRDTHQSSRDLIANLRKAKSQCGVPERNQHLSQIDLIAPKLNLGELVEKALSPLDVLRKKGKTPILDLPYPAYRLPPDSKNRTLKDYVKHIGSGFPSEVCNQYVACKLGYDKISLPQRIADLSIKTFKANGFEVVDSAQKGDLILYFDPDNSSEILHIGLISKVEKGEVWVESKWGVTPIYEHREDAVPENYSTGVVYLRNPKFSKIFEAKNRPGQCDHHTQLTINYHADLLRGTPTDSEIDESAPAEVAWIKFTEKVLEGLASEWRTEASDALCSPHFEERVSLHVEKGVSAIKNLSPLKALFGGLKRPVAEQIQQFNKNVTDDFKALCVSDKVFPD